MLQYDSLTNYGVKNVIKINLGGVSLLTGYEFIALEKTYPGGINFSLEIPTNLAERYD